MLHDAYIFLDNFPFSYVDLLLHVPLFPLQRLSNGSLEPAHEASQVVELQDLLEKQNYELAQMKERMSSLSSRVSEVEQELETARKDLIKSEEMNNKYQRDIKEVTAHKLSTGGSIHTHTHTYSHGDNSCKRNIKDSEQWSKNSFYLHMLSHSPQLFITPSFSHIKTCTLACERIGSFIMPSSGEVS